MGGVIVAGAVGIWLWFNRSGQSSQSGNYAATSMANTKSEQAEFFIYNLGLSRVSPASASESNTGDVVVNSDALREFKTRGLKGFYVFGEPLEGGRLNPNFEFASLTAATKVISAIEGVVLEIKTQSANDSELFIQPNANSAWVIGYDHIANVAVKKGDTVRVGTLLGNPAIQNNGLYRFEFQINQEDGANSRHICPTTLLHATVKDSVIADLVKMESAWESLGGPDMYNQSAESPAGCLKTSLTPLEAEGR